MSLSLVSLGFPKSSFAFLFVPIRVGAAANGIEIHHSDCRGSAQIVASASCRLRTDPIIGLQKCGSQPAKVIAVTKSGDIRTIVEKYLKSIS